jgi:transglutaminase-like putative cysteine protease
MLPCLPWLLGICLTAPGDTPGIVETWETAYLDGARIGCCQTCTQTLGEGSERRIRTLSTLDLALRRNSSQVRLRVEHGTEETPEGKVVGVLVRYLHDGVVQLRLVGTLDGDRMRVVGEGQPETRIRWSDEVVGLARRDRLLAERRLRAGDRFSFPAYEPVVNTVVTVRVCARGPEEVVLPSGRRTLLRVELTPDRLEAPGMSLQLPPTVFWLDDDFRIVRRQVELDSLGAIILVPASREAALAPVTAAPRSADLSLRAQIPLNRTLPRPAQARSATYRVTLRGDADAASAFVQDGHQDVRPIRGDAFELTVHPVHPNPAPGAAGPAAEFLGSSRYLDAADARVRELADRVVAGESNPWRRAQRLEQWVRSNLRVDNAAPLAPASAVARDLRGDCRHAALLTAALCRAAGVPARTAIGLVYVERNKQPNLGFHMWTEVCIGGQWLGLDATPGIGPVGVGHLKVTDHSWEGVTSLTPLIPLQRVIGKAAVEILAVDPGNAP